MALETPSRPPPAFMANAILNFHFDYLTTSLILKAREKFMINCIEQEGRPESGPSTIRWVKIFTWRANGDGIGLGKHTLLEGDFYIHSYTYSLQVHRLV